MEKKIFKGLINRNQIFAFFKVQSMWSFTIVLPNFDSLGLGNLLANFEVPSAGGFREEVENVKIWFFSHNFMANVGGTTNT